MDYVIFLEKLKLKNEEIERLKEENRELKLQKEEMLNEIVYIKAVADDVLKLCDNEEGMNPNTTKEVVEKALNNKLNDEDAIKFVKGDKKVIERLKKKTILN